MPSQRLVPLNAGLKSISRSIRWLPDVKVLTLQGQNVPISSEEPTQKSDV